jgi:DNA-binding transcriptional MerR regulator
VPSVRPSQRPSAAPRGSGPKAFRLEELAKAAGTTARNVRAYRERGLLHAPRYEGRVALYDESHLARLRTIAALLERGYSTENIRELTTAWERGQKLENVLGLEAAITTPFVDEAPEVVDASELLTALGPTATPAVIARALELRVLVLEGAELRTPSPKLLSAGIELVRAGVPLDAILDELAVLRAALDQIARRFVDLVGRHLVDAPGRSMAGASMAGGSMPGPSATKRLERSIRKIRPLAEVVVEVELAQSLDREIRRQLTTRLGALATKQKRPKKKG